QNDDDPREAEHLGLLLTARLREKDVEDGDDDADARDLVNHRGVQLHGLCPPPAGRPAPAVSTGAAPRPAPRSRPRSATDAPPRPAPPLPARPWSAGRAGPPAGS